MDSQLQASRLRWRPLLLAVSLAAAILEPVLGRLDERISTKHYPVSGCGACVVLYHREAVARTASQFACPLRTARCWTTREQLSWFHQQDIRRESDGTKQLEDCIAFELHSRR